MATALPVQLDALKAVSTRAAMAIIAAVCALALALLVFTIYGHAQAAEAPGWVAGLPALNAFLNSCSAVLLTLALFAIRRRDVQSHSRYMLGALATSALFLISYLVYHSIHGDSKFAGQGPIRPVYFFILISHIALSAAVLPLIFVSFFFSLSGRFPQHRRIARYAMPVWMYVSVTGVLVFALLRAYA